MARNVFTPKVSKFPLGNVSKVPLGQAIASVGRLTGMNAQQAGISAALTQAGLNQTPTLVIGNAKPKQ